MNTIEFCGIEFAKKPTAALEVINTDVAKDKEVEVEVAEPKEKENTKKKFPRLNELYGKLFDDVLPDDLHNSIIDVLVCLRCFLKIRGVKEMSSQDFFKLIEKYSR
jgi:hypothetical protein